MSIPTPAPTPPPIPERNSQTSFADRMEQWWVFLSAFFTYLTTLVADLNAWVASVPIAQLDDGSIAPDRVWSSSKLNAEIHGSATISTAYAVSETFTVDSSGERYFQGGDGQTDPEDWITLSDMSIRPRRDAGMIVVAQCTINTDQTSIGDGAAIVAEINGELYSVTNGEYSRAGSSDDGEELRFIYVAPMNVQSGDVIRFKLMSLTDGKEITMSSQIKLYAK